MNRKSTILLILFSTLIITFLSSLSIPVSPNEYDSIGKKTGQWTIFCNDEFEYVDDITLAKYYRVITYKDGKPYGLVKDYYLSGQLFGTRNLISDNPDVYDGLVENYFENGQKMISCNFINGKEHGILMLWNEEGKTQAVYEYANGILNGISKIYNDDGSYLVTNLVNGNREGLSTSYSADGNKISEGNYKNGEVNGKWMWWNSEGIKLSEGEYLNGKKHGDWTWWLPDGNMFTWGEYLNDEKIGVWFEYDNTGNLNAVPYPDGKSAVKRYQTLAARGEIDANFFIGILYLKGSGVIQDYAEAFKNFKLSADKGFAEAQYYVGFCYDSGFGVTQDYTKAFTWYLLSCSYSSNNFNAVATQAKDAVKFKLSQADILKATNDAKAIQSQIDNKK